MIAFVALSLAVSSSAGRAEEIALSRAEGMRFAAMSLTSGQGVRAVVSNVLLSTGVADLAPCNVQVSFFGADGSLIEKTTTVQLKAGELTSVPASNPPKLVRAAVSIDAASPPNACALRTTLEVFDVQTGTTFVVVPSENIDSNNECNVSVVAQPLRAARRNVSARGTAAPGASSSLHAAPRRTSSPVLASTPPAPPR